jgi:uncharacterized protein
MAWDITNFDQLDITSFDALTDIQTDLVLLGCGSSMRLPSRALRDAWKSQGLNIELMETGAACRSYNFLLSEGRQVAAALIGLDKD